MSTQSKTKQKRSISVPRPSASVLIISPANQVLLLHRVQTSSAFPSAHVFPGGNLSTFHDGPVPAPDHPSVHEDSEVYRLGAIRETFEETGLLLARSADTGRLIQVKDEERDLGRRAVHRSEIRFLEWLRQRGGLADTGSLLPFTRWVTPSNVPKRFTTQMYLYFLPIGPSTDKSTSGPVDTSELIIPKPTPDGGIEHTAARYLPPATWISMQLAREIILFPPQLFLLHLLAQFFTQKSTSSILDPRTLEQQRGALVEFVRTGDPPWTEKCISPTVMFTRRTDGRIVLGLEKPGAELEGSGRRGDDDRVILTRFSREGTRDVEVMARKEVCADDADDKGKL